MIQCVLNLIHKSKTNDFHTIITTSSVTSVCKQLGFWNSTQIILLLTTFKSVPGTNQY